MMDALLSSVEYISIFIGIIIVTIIIASLVNRFFRKMIKKATEDMMNDPTNYKFLRHAIVAIIYIVGFSIAIYMMPNLRTLAGSLLAGAGILAVSVGFASQHALSNIIGGIFIIIFKPFRVNDRVSLRNMQGVIEDITLRHTVIRDFENQRIIIPNAVISDEVIINANFLDDKICKWIDMGISYNSDIDLARQIMKEEIEAHLLSIDPRTPEQIENGDELVPVRVLSLGDSSVNLRGWAWAKDAPDGFKMKCDLLESIKKRFDREGISIPFPHRTLVQGSDFVFTKDKGDE